MSNACRVAALYCSSVGDATRGAYGRHATCDRYCSLPRCLHQSMLLHAHQMEHAGDLVMTACGRLVVQHAHTMTAFCTQAVCAYMCVVGGQNLSHYGFWAQATIRVL